MRVVVVGAGLAGLSAARALTVAGHEVTVFDKGRGPGGRMATRRIGAARVDHGAQFFTVRSDAFAAFVQPFVDDGLVVEWSRGFAQFGTNAEPDGFPRYRVRDGMNALPKALAEGLDVRCSSLVFAIRRSPAGGHSASRWSVGLDDATSLDVDALVVTCPLAQSFSLLVTAEVAVPETLWRTEYDRTLALLAVLDRPTAVPAPGGLQGAPGFTFVADNAAKGISDVPVLTAHADPAWSEAHWNLPHEEALDLLVEAAAPWIGEAVIVERQLKRWRFATPRVIWPDACWFDDSFAPVALAGDAFAGPRVEGAVLSGLAAAAALG